MKHTPTPWIIDENRDDFGDLILLAENHDFKPLETPRDIRIASVVHDEDAENIVKCVNSHDELLEAAKDAVFDIKSLGQQIIMLHNQNARKGIHSDALTTLSNETIIQMVQRLEKAIAEATK